jgi:hypothetical protein
MRLAIVHPEFLTSYRRGAAAHAARYSWDRAAAVTLDVYRRVLGIPMAATPSRRAA